MNDQETAKTSATGINRYLHWCEVRSQRHYYAACAWKVDKYVNAKMEDIQSVDPNGNECATYIKNGRCPAVAMREQELLVDKPLYFTPHFPENDSSINRVKLANGVINYGSRSYLQGFFKPDMAQYPNRRATDQPPKSAKKLSSKTQKKSGLDIKDVTAQDVINQGQTE